MYLANKDTEFILFKPIKTKIASLVDEANNFLVKNYNADELVIISRLSKEEVSCLATNLFENV